MFSRVFSVPHTEDYGREWLRKLAEAIPPGSKVLDAGAGQCQYKPFFAHCDYTAVDLCVGDDNWDFSQIDINAPLHEIPVPDASFDYVVCTQVLEHVPNPAEVIKEFGRVCKPGGKLFLAVPFSAREHQVPYDFFRYTRYGLERLMIDAGWDVECIEPVRGDMYRLMGVLSETGHHFQGVQKVFRIPFYIFKAFLAVTLPFYEKFERDSHGTSAWHAIARKI